MREGTAPGQGFLEKVVAVAPHLELGEARPLPAEVADRAAAAFFELVVGSPGNRELPAR